MANVNWNGGKAKGRAQAKAWLRHNDTEKRPETNHGNADIDKELTHLNAEVGVCADLTYEQKAARLDALLDEFDYQEGKGKNKRVSMLAVTIYPPDGLLEYDGEMDTWRDTPELRRWFELANAEWEGFAGADNCVGSSLHYDEQHWYIPKGETEKRLSKPHLQADAVPVIGGRICGKDFASRERIRELNGRIEDMTRREFGMQYNTGLSKPPRKKSVKELKRESERVGEVVIDLEKALADLSAAEQKIADMRGEAYTGADGRTYAGMSAINRRRDEELDRMRKASAKADAQERRADSAAKRADSARRKAESFAAVADAAKQRLKDALDEEREVHSRMDNIEEREKAVAASEAELQEQATAIVENIDTSADMVEPWDTFVATLKATNTISYFTDDDLASFEAVEAARNRQPYALKALEKAREKLQQLLLFLQRQRQREERVKVDMATIDEYQKFGDRQYDGMSL